MTEVSLHHLFPFADVTNWDIETDVAVIGFGAAGACAAIEAAAAGAQVTLFERNSGSGGASGLSGGEIYIGGGGGSDVQRDAGFSDSTADFEAYLVMAGGPAADRDKCAIYAAQALAHFDWLKQQGVPYKGTYIPGKVIEPIEDDTLIWSGSEAAEPFCLSARPAPRGHVIQFMGWGGGRLLVDILEARVRDAGCDVMCDARVVALIGDGARIAGVVVRIDNRNHFVRVRRGVVLATGGFCMNREMLARHAPDALRLASPIGDKDDGVGIQLGLAAGGEAVHMDQFFSTCPWTIPEPLSCGVFVNSKGQRFINEDCYHGRVSRVMLDQPGDRAYLLVDNAIFQRPLDIARISIAAVGDSWEEVEAELGMAEGALAPNMHFYNRHAVNGADPLFGKRPPILRALLEPPFAALELNFDTSYFSFFTLGGLHTTVDGEVLNRAGQPIAGLFAAGRATSGLPAWGHGYSSGMSLADATFFGRKAGMAAAR
jgi:succinate dehydrogenase/fumarate reductase flavoprotein subunit